MASVEERISGFTVRGTWPDIVEHGEQITAALQEADVSGDAFEEWEAWRPKPHDRLDQEMNVKTSDQASIDEGAGERAGISAGQDLQDAGQKLQEATDELRDEDSDAALDRLQQSVGHARRAADTAGRQALRSVQDTVYQHVMTALSPQYFNNELISACIRRQGQLGNDGSFEFEVNINDDDLKAEIGDRLAEYEAEIDRWHLDVQPETGAIEAAESVETPG